jgi:hypothetical protein
MDNAKVKAKQIYKTCLKMCKASGMFTDKNVNLSAKEAALLSVDKSIFFLQKVKKELFKIEI